jgi:translation elongation factor EF-4
MLILQQIHSKEVVSTMHGVILKKKQKKTLNKRKENEKKMSFFRDYKIQQKSFHNEWS